MKKLKKDQRGLTLIELVMVIAAIALITGATTMSIMDMFNTNIRTSNRMTAVRQVEYAGFWVSPDVQMANNVSTEPEFLKLSWIEWETNDLHEVIYTLEDMSGGLKKLQREHYIDSDLDSTIVVAEYIDPDQTSCVWAGGELIFTVTAAVGTQSETRQYAVKPRPGSY
jgi:prepilin-type N-terminal cleavage/methylation domain-containing protein